MNGDKEPSVNTHENIWILVHYQSYDESVLTDSWKYANSIWSFEKNHGYEYLFLKDLKVKVNKMEGFEEEQQVVFCKLKTTTLRNLGQITCLLWSSNIFQITHLLWSSNIFQ